MSNKYSVILGNLGNTCDRFCKGYKDNPSTEEMLEMVVSNQKSKRAACFFAGLVFSAAVSCLYAQQNLDPKAEGDKILDRLVKVTAEVMKGAHDANMALLKPSR